MLGERQGRYKDVWFGDCVVFDLETTGLSTEADEIIEIGAVRMRNGEAEETFQTLVNPGRPIAARVSEINGITDDMVAGAPGIREALTAFLAFAGEDVLVGHNSACFDMAFLQRAAERCFSQQITNDHADTLSMAKSLIPEVNRYGLGLLAGLFGISTEGAHRALADAKMTAGVYRELCFREKNDPRQTKIRICPDCGAVMIRRKGRYGDFYGCGNYPRCRHTEKIR